MNNSLLKYILQQAETSPDDIKFYESELSNISQSSFNAFKKQKYLIYDQYDLEKVTIIDKQGNERFIRKVKGKWLAISTEDNEISPIVMTNKDVNRYSFDIKHLLKDIKSKNNLSGSIDTISPRTYLIGVKTLLDKKIGIILCLLADDEQAEAELLSLKSKVSQSDVILVLCPYFTITSQSILKKLQDQAIFPMCFGDVFKDNDFTIDNRIFQKMYLPDSELKGKKVFVKFPTPAGTKWEDVTIQIVSNDSVKITINGIYKRYTYAQIGFIDKRKGDLPDSQWEVLKALAQENGEISWNSKSAQEKMQKKIQTIRRRLEVVMGISGDPFHCYKANRSYKTKFKIEDKSYTQKDSGSYE